MAAWEVRCVRAGFSGSSGPLRTSEPTGSRVRGRSWSQPRRRPPARRCRGSPSPASSQTPRSVSSLPRRRRARTRKAGRRRCSSPPPSATISASVRDAGRPSPGPRYWPVRRGSHRRATGDRRAARHRCPATSAPSFRSESGSPGRAGHDPAVTSPRAGAPSGPGRPGRSSPRRPLASCPDAPVLPRRAADRRVRARPAPATGPGVARASLHALPAADRPPGGRARTTLERLETLRWWLQAAWSTGGDSPGATNAIVLDDQPAELRTFTAMPGIATTARDGPLLVTAGTEDPSSATGLRGCTSSRTRWPTSSSARRMPGAPRWFHEGSPGTSRRWWRWTTTGCDSASCGSTSSQGAWHRGHRAVRHLTDASRPAPLAGRNASRNWATGGREDG